LRTLPPHSKARVGDVAQHGRNGGDLPSVLAAMRVTARVCSAGTRDPVRVQLAHDRSHRLAGQVRSEDPSHNRRGRRVRHQPVVLPLRGPSPLAVRPDRDEPVTVRWPATDVVRIARPDGDLLLVANPLSDHLALLPAEDAVHRQDEVVRSVQRVIRSADLPQPDRDTPLKQTGRHVEELHAVEGALSLADHDRVPAALRISRVVKQPVGLGASGPGQRTAVATVKVGRDDQAAR
jgi:hypothetical protein